MNIDEWKAINILTGEELTIPEFDKERRKDTGSFQLAHTYFLLRYLETIDTPSMVLLQYFIKHKNGRNQILATQKKIAEESGVSLITVKKTMKKLLANGSMIKISNGLYMLNPLILSFGSSTLNINKHTWGELHNV